MKRKKPDIEPDAEANETARQIDLQQRQALADSVPLHRAYCETHDEMHRQVVHVGVVEYDKEVVITVTSRKPVRIHGVPNVILTGGGGSGGAGNVSVTLPKGVALR